MKVNLLQRGMPISEGKKVENITAKVNAEQKALFAISSTRQSGIVWNLAIDTNTTKNLVLDAKNAAFAY